MVYASMHVGNCEVSLCMEANYKGGAGMQLRNAMFTVYTPTLLKCL